MSSEWGVEQSPAHDKCYGGIDAHKYQRKYAVYEHDPISVHDCTRTWLFTHPSGEEASFLMPFVSPFNNNIFFAAEHADFSRMYGRKITRRNGFTPRILKSKTIGSISRMFSPILANVRDKFEKIAWRDDRAPISCKTIITHFHDPEQFPVERSIFPDDKTPLSRIRISRLRNKGNRKALGHRSISFAVIKTFDDITKKDTKIDRELRYSLSSPRRILVSSILLSRVHEFVGRSVNRFLA